MAERALWALEKDVWTGDVPTYAARLAPMALLVFPQPAGVLD